MTPNPSNSSSRNLISKVRHSLAILRLARISATRWTNMETFTAGATTRMVSLALVTPIPEPNLHRFEFSARISNIWDANRCSTANSSRSDSSRRTCLPLRSRSRFCLSAKTTPAPTFPSVIRSPSPLTAIGVWHPQKSRKSHSVSAWHTNLANQGPKRMKGLLKTDFSHNSQVEINGKHSTRQPKTPSNNIASTQDHTRTMLLNSRKPFKRAKLTLET